MSPQDVTDHVWGKNHLCSDFHIHMSLCAEKRDTRGPCLAVQQLLTAPAQLLPLPDNAEHTTTMCNTLLLLRVENM